MDYSDKAIAEIVQKVKYLEPAIIQDALADAKATGQPLKDYLINKNLLNRDLLGQAIAESLNIDYVDLNSNPPAKELAGIIPPELAQKYRIVLYKQEKDQVHLVTDHPDKFPSAKVELEQLFKGKKLILGFSMPQDIDNSLLDYRADFSIRISEIIKSTEKFTPLLIDEIFKEALIERASDIHFEPFKGEVIIRFRVDGVLIHIAKIDPEYYANILNRIKVLSGLRVDDHFSAQDGALRYSTGETAIDMRISIAPVINGEKITIRILSSYVETLNLQELGLAAKDEEIVEYSSKKPYGMILTVGPTGSGKTTTLYAILQLLNDVKVNITTIEDPVEYKVKGINQIQVNKETNLTFANGLRSIVRQDPDIILVGEIRDKETAEIAVNASMTGHLLLSTFHANDAATAIPRLLDMGIEPFLLASGIELIVAQRLVRKICQNCIHSYEFNKKDLKRKINKTQEKLLPKDGTTLYTGKGCDVCQNTGYSGRTAIFELVQVTEEIRDLILNDPASTAIWEKAKEQGAHSFFEDGINKVKSGMITIEELFRVAPLDLNVA